jgi:hypothetical protein
VRRKPPPGTIVRQPQILKRDGTTIVCVGCHHLSDDEWPLLFELLITGPRHDLLPVGAMRFYTTPDSLEPPIAIVPQFILDPSGESLIGSYLHPPEQDFYWSRDGWRPTTIRFASFFPETSGGDLWTPLGAISFYDSEPCPDRLLRLIWVDSS